LLPFLALITHLKGYPITQKMEECTSPDAYGRGQRITTTGIDYCIKQFAQQTKLANLSANTLRHSFIVDQLKAVRDAKRVSKIAGHVKLATTLRHLDPYLRVPTPLVTPV
jgi:site-specific recombinase XerC